MSIKHPVIAVTGSSGAGTSTVTKVFENIFRREGVTAAVIEGDSFHRFDRHEFKRINSERAEAGEPRLSHFGPEANLLKELENLFRTYGECGRGARRYYVHDDDEASRRGSAPGTFTPWQDLPAGTDMLFYEGLHGAVRTADVNVAHYADLMIGVVPVINLEWIQKIHRDTNLRGYSKEAVMDTILSRMPDYVHYIVPQFEHTHINFQRVPVVDTSNPFIARDIPGPGESMVVIRFRNPRGVDFPYLRAMIKDSFMSRANTIVVPGDKLDIAMQLILTPLIWGLMEKKKLA